VSKWGRRERWVYAYDVIDLRPQSVHVEVGYVGKSSSKLLYRDAQHRHGKVWAWAIVGEIRPVWHGECGRVSLWFREVYYIRKLRPLFNVDWNRHNRNRITPWVARRLYERRDLSYGGPVGGLRPTPR
jgi:hypothetical protein